MKTFALLFACFALSGCAQYVDSTWYIQELVSKHDPRWITDWTLARSSPEDVCNGIMALSGFESRGSPFVGDAVLGVQAVFFQLGSGWPGLTPEDIEQMQIMCVRSTASYVRVTGVGVEAIDALRPKAASKAVSDEIQYRVLGIEGKVDDSAPLDIWLKSHTLPEPL